MNPISRQQFPVTAAPSGNEQATDPRCRMRRLYQSAALAALALGFAALPFSLNFDRGIDFAAAYADSGEGGDGGSDGGEGSEGAGDDHEGGDDSGPDEAGDDHEAGEDGDDHEAGDDDDQGDDDQGDDDQGDDEAGDDDAGEDGPDDASITVIIPAP